MTLTDKHHAFENDCRQMFVGQTIRAVVYGETEWFADEDGKNTNPEPSYNTKFPAIDTLDYSIYFRTDAKTVYVSWDNTFTCYGLLSKQVDLTETINSYEQKWDVSSDEKWIKLIGQQIIDFKVIWEESWTSNLDGTNKIITMYPQTFVINTENGKTIILSASELSREGENAIHSQMDNLLVTTNVNLARRLKII